MRPRPDQGVGQLEGPEDQAMDDKDNRDTAESEPYPVPVQPQCLGPGEGASLRAHFTSMGLRLPVAETLISLRPSTPRTHSSRRV